jgi:hypothetical protein
VDDFLQGPVAETSLGALTRDTLAR